MSREKRLISPLLKQGVLRRHLVKRNIQRFPQEFMFRLTIAEKKNW